MSIVPLLKAATQGLALSLAAVAFIVGAIEKLIFLTCSAEYVFVIGGCPALRHEAFASRTVMLPSALTDDTIPVCPIELLKGFDTNIPQACGVALCPILAIVAFLAFRESPIHADDPVTDFQ